jgi:hypothetical protein
MGESLQLLGSADELIKFSPNAVGEFACEAIKFVRANCQFSRARKWNSASTQGRESARSHRSQYTYRAICANPLLINACDFFSRSDGDCDLSQTQPPQSLALRGDDFERSAIGAI